MKTYNTSQDRNNFVKNRLVESAFYSNNFNEIPPIFGIIVADQYGNTIIVLENAAKNSDKKGTIKSYLSGDDKNLLEIDLISMYFSSLKTFAKQTNIQNISHLEIYGSNIKVQIYFLFNKYMIIVFLNSHTELNIKQKKEIINFFEEKFIKYDFEFNNFNATNSRKVLNMLENLGKRWLKNLNKNYIQTYKKEYLKKHKIIEAIMDDLSPIIQSELDEYLKSIPNDILNNLLKELKNKIQDKLFEFKSL